MGPGLLPDDEAGGGTSNGDDKEDELANSVELSDDDAGWGADKLDEPVTAEVEMKEDEEAELSGELSEEGWGMDAGTN